ncbi:uncharacterized protein [Ptychodera flava]|uniref:uncharacterized protein n=1 Tax=Ptychodera flava TaxID=63121 RepID=UPI003969D8E1
MAKDLKCDIKMMNQRCKVEENAKIKLPSKENSVLELASMEERRLALRLERLNLENKSQLKHLARETREVREMIRKQQVLDTVGVSPRGSMDRLNLPPIHSLDSQFRKRSTSNPTSPRRARRPSRMDTPGSALRRSSLATTPPAVTDSRSGSRSPGTISVNDLGKLTPIIRRAASGHSLSVASLDSPDSDLSDSFNGGSTPPIISVEGCTHSPTPPPEGGSRISPRRLDRLDFASASPRTSPVDLPIAEKDNGSSSASFDGPSLAPIRQTSSDSNLVLQRERSEVCLDPRFKRLESVLIPGKCKADEEDGDQSENPSDGRASSATGDDKVHKESFPDVSRSGQKPVRLVPIRYDSNLTTREKT